MTSTAGGPQLDLAITGGTVVTAAGESVTDVGIAGGRIVQLGGELAAARRIDAGGKLVLPGGIDMHVHLSPPWVDDFASGSRAAAAGGVTTIGNMVFPEAGEGLRAALDRTAATAGEESVVDFVLHPVLSDPSPEAVAELPGLAADGHTSVKVFMIGGGFDPRAVDYLRALATAGQHGMLAMVHCEDGPLVDYATAELVAGGRGDLCHYGETRPPRSEAVAVARMIAYAGRTGTAVYLVHLGSAAGLEEARRARARGQQVYVETRPIYLHFTEEVFARPDGGLYVGNPPLGTGTDQEALWAGLAAGDVHTCCTDHAAWTREQKLDPSLDVASARPGMSDLETLLPLLYSRGVRTGRLSLSRFVEITATNAAKLFGLFPRKGTIAVGSDADLVVWDPDASRVLTGDEGHSRAGHNLYGGWEVVGWPAVTLSRGEVVAEAGQVVAPPGRGRLVRRERTRPL